MTTAVIMSLTGAAAPALADTGPPTAEIQIPDGVLEPEVIPVNVIAADDTSIASVQLYAGTRLVGTLTQPPYLFQFQPTVDDLFGQTLIALVTDGAGFQTTVLRRVLITNFKAERLVARTRYFPSARAPYTVQTSGRLVRPAALSSGYGCTSGIIVDYAWKGGRTSTRASLNQRQCSFRTSRIYLPKKGRIRVTVAYLGDNALAGLSRRHTIRVG